MLSKIIICIKSSEIIFRNLKNYLYFFAQFEEKLFEYCYKLTLILILDSHL